MWKAKLPRPRQVQGLQVQGQVHQCVQDCMLQEDGTELPAGADRPRGDHRDSGHACCQQTVQQAARQRRPVCGSVPRAPAGRSRPCRARRCSSLAVLATAGATAIGQAIARAEPWRPGPASGSMAAKSIAIGTNVVGLRQEQQRDPLTRYALGSDRCPIGGDKGCNRLQECRRSHADGSNASGSRARSATGPPASRRNKEGACRRGPPAWKAPQFLFREEAAQG